MAAWLTFFRERFPVPVYVALVGGFSVSGSLLGAGAVAALPTAVSFLGLFAFFALLRLMDERKDFETDQVAHPDRPLPRGLLSLETVDRGIRIGALGLLGWAAVAALATTLEAGLCWVVAAVWLWLMYREFYLGSWLGERPFLYALTHQIVLLPLCLFCVLVVARPPDDRWLYFAVTVLGAFFAYEVCRKLDPNAHPALRTYLAVYGRVSTLLVVAGALAMAAVGADGLGLGTLLWPVQVIVVLSLAVIWLRPGAYKIPENLAGVGLLVHLWAVPLQAFVPKLWSSV